MPELPEVETIKRGLSPHLIHQTIQKMVIRQSQLRWPIPSSLTTELPGQTITAIERRSKYLLIHTNQGCLIIHLGMSGKLTLVSQSTPAIKHDHVDILLNNQQCLRYNDPRRFGAILWSKNPTEHPRLKTLGPEPLERRFNSNYLHRCCHNKNASIKSVIMNAKIVVGVGNIYANEALFHCGIHPLTPAKQLSTAACQDLCQQIKKTLKRAIAAGGTTLKDFANAEGKPGYFQQKLWVYGRAQQPCRQCKTPIERLTQQQRSSFFCPRCQKAP